MPSHCLNQWWHCQKGQTYVEFNSISAQYVQLYQSFWWLIQSFPTILDISSSVLKFRWKKPISSMKPLWFSLSGIEQKYNWRIFIFCPFLLLFHLFIHFQTFSYFFQFLPFQVEEPISSSKPSQFPGSNEHVNSNETVKYWYSAQLCCCFISLENYNFLQEKILPTRYSYIFKLFFIFTPVSSTSSERNLFLPGSHHSFWFHFLWKEQQ